jgi:branched-chain amino acid transport system ATP-binding protein
MNSPYVIPFLEVVAACKIDPAFWLSPLLVDRQFVLIQEVNRQGTTIFMVEQNANMALSIADRGYVLQTGAIVLADTARNLLCNEMMQEAYLGGENTCDGLKGIEGGID